MRRSRPAAPRRRRRLRGDEREVTETLRLAASGPGVPNRIDEVIVFHALTHAHLERIVDTAAADSTSGWRTAHHDRGDRRGSRVDRREGRIRFTGPGRSSARSSASSRARWHVPCSREFKPGDRVTADADLVSGTLLRPRGRRSSPTARHDVMPGPRWGPVSGTAERRQRARSPAADGAQASAHRRRARQLAPPTPRSQTLKDARFAEVLERLATLPAEPPEGPASLMPVLVEGGTVRLRERSPDEAMSPRAAAVLVLVYPDADGEARVLLTERVDRGGHHSGEVSFPGGRAEPEDADLTATALREAAEEVGLDPVAAGLRVLSVWPPHWIPVSDYAVTPVLAVADRLPALVAQPTEVARIVEAPIRLFLPEAQLLEVDREVRGWRLRYTAYPVDGLVVWGMTARVLGRWGHCSGTCRRPEEGCWARARPGWLSRFALARIARTPGVWCQLPDPARDPGRLASASSRARPPTTAIVSSRELDDEGAHL